VILRDRLQRSVSAEAADEADDQLCQSCGAVALVAFYETENVPTQTCVLLGSESEALDYPTGQLLLALCESCGFIQNIRFDSERVDYSKPTEESQAFSGTFQRFANDLAGDLLERYELRGKTVLEVGCGKGDFLALLAERGIRAGLGVDPGFLPNRPEASAEVLRFIRAAYGPDSSDLTGDLVLTRHLLEHIPNVGEFLGWLTRSIDERHRGVLFTEVPDTERVLEEGAFWDVYYEHCSYFTLGSLRRAVIRTGLHVDYLTRGFGDQYLLCGATRTGSCPDAPLPDDIAMLTEKVVAFAARARVGRRKWRSRIERNQSAGGTVAVWGGGSKTVAFLAAIGLDGVTVVDINPHKQGKWLPTIGVKVQHPQVLKSESPNLVIPMNPMYVVEITHDLHRMGLEPAIHAL
jgi:SAM-dependent methyltransferase